MVSYLFSLQGRMGRIAYLFNATLAEATTVFLLWSWFDAGLPYYGLWLVPNLVVIALFFAIIYSFTVRRLNDINQIGIIFALLVLVPIVNLLIIVPLLLFRGSR